MTTIFFTKLCSVVAARIFRHSFGFSGEGQQLAQVLRDGRCSGLCGGAGIT